MPSVINLEVILDICKPVHLLAFKDLWTSGRLIRLLRHFKGDLSFQTFLNVITSGRYAKDQVNRPYFAQVPLYFYAFWSNIQVNQESLSLLWELELNFTSYNIYTFTYTVECKIRGEVTRVRETLQKGCFYYKVGSLHWKGIRKTFLRTSLIYSFLRHQWSVWKPHSDRRHFCLLRNLEVHLTFKRTYHLSWPVKDPLTFWNKNLVWHPIE